MLLDINKLFLIEQKILNILVFSIQSENRHHIYLFFFPPIFQSTVEISSSSSNECFQFFGVVEFFNFFSY